MGLKEVYKGIGKAAVITSVIVGPGIFQSCSQTSREDNFLESKPVISLHIIYSYDDLKLNLSTNAPGLTIRVITDEYNPLTTKNSAFIEDKVGLVPEDQKPEKPKRSLKTHTKSRT